MTDPAQPHPSAVHSRHATGYLLLGLLASLMPAPFNLFAVVPLIAAIVEHVLVLRALNSHQTPGAPRAWTAFGLGITTMLLGSLLLPYATSGNRDYTECMTGANTKQAEQDCTKRYQ